MKEEVVMCIENALDGILPYDGPTDRPEDELLSEIGGETAGNTDDGTPGCIPEDVEYMREAMRLAMEAEAIDEVPVGALVVRNGEIIAKAYNTREHSRCATHHAEILAIEAACRALGGWRLIGCTLYVTMEPCAMCAGAIINARLPRVVFGAPDLRFGAFGSLINLADVPLNHKPEIVGGVLKEENVNILRSYFKKKR
jgi:tRNA(adenine34) deaminase